MADNDCSLKWLCFETGLILVFFRVEINVTIEFCIKFYKRQCSYLKFPKFCLWSFFIRAPQFWRNLKNTSKKTFQLLLLKMTTFCLHTATNIQASHRSIHKSWSGNFSHRLHNHSLQRVQNSVPRGYSNIPLLPTTIYRIKDWGLGRRTGRSSNLMKSGIRSYNHFCIFFPLYEWV